MNPLPDRICDYIVLCEYSRSKLASRVISRFPFEDHADADFPTFIEDFCFPYENTTLPKKEEKLLQHTFVMTEGNGARVYAACCVFYVSKETMPPDYKGKHYRAICVTSHWPFFINFQNFVYQLYKRTSGETEELKNVVSFDEDLIPVERIASNYIFESPLPPCGKISVKVTPFFKFEQTFKRSPSNRLELLYFDLSVFTESISIENIILIFAALLNEKRILILSNDISKLTIIAESLNAILFPFVWGHVYVPLCPKKYLKILEAPFSFICGYKTNFLTNDIDLSEIFVINVDKDKIVHHPDNIIFPVPEIYSKIIKKYFNNQQKKKIKKLTLIKNKVEYMREAFLKCFVNMMAGYHAFFYDEFNGNETKFDVEKFIKTKPKNTHRFFEMFTKTQIFQCFIDQASLSIYDKTVTSATILFFNECIKSKMFHNDNDFLQDTSMEHKEVFKCLLPDNFGVNKFGNELNYLTFPEFKESFFRNPRKVQSLTSETERYQGDMTYNLSSYINYFQKKITYSKYIKNFKSLTSNQNHLFDELVRHLYLSKKTDQEISELLKRRSAFPHSETETNTFLDQISRHLSDIVKSNSASFSELSDGQFSLVSSFIVSTYKHLSALEENFSSFSKLQERAAAQKNLLERLMQKKEKCQQVYKHAIVDISNSSSILVDGSNYNSLTALKNVVNLSRQSNSSILNYEFEDLYFNLLNDYYEVKMSTVSDNIKQESIERVQELKQVSIDVAKLHIDYHKKQLEKYEDLLKKATLIESTKCIGILSEDSHKEIVKLQSSDNMLLLKKEEVVNIKTENEQMNSFYSYNFWGKNSIDNVISEIKVSISDTENFIKFNEELKEILTTSISNSKRLSRKLKKYINYKLTKTRTDEVKKICLSTNSFTDKLCNHLNKVISRNVFELIYTKDQMKSSIDLVKDNLAKISDRIKNYQQKKTSAKENITRIESDMENTFQQFLKTQSITKISKISNSQSFSLIEMDSVLKIYSSKVKKLTRYQSELDSIEKELEILDKHYELSVAYSLDFFQDVNKQRYMCVKSCLTRTINVVSSFTKEKELLLNAIENKVSKLTVESIRNDYYKFFVPDSKELSESKSMDFSDVIIKNYDKVIPKIFQKDQEIKKCVVFFSNFIVSCLNYWDELKYMFDRSRFEALTFTCVNSQYLNSCVYNLIYSMKNISEHKISTKKEMRALGTRMLKIQQTYNETIKEIFNNQDENLQNLFNEHKKKESKQTKYPWKKNSNVILQNMEKTRKEIEKYVPGIKRILRQLYEIEEEIILSIKTVLIEHISFERKETANTKGQLENYKEMLKTLNLFFDTRVYFDREKTTDIPPDFVMLYLKKLHKSETDKEFKKTCGIPFGSTTKQVKDQTDNKEVNFQRALSNLLQSNVEQKYFNSNTFAEKSGLIRVPSDLESPQSSSPSAVKTPPAYDRGLFKQKSEVLGLGVHEAKKRSESAEKNDKIRSKSASFNHESSESPEKSPKEAVEDTNQLENDKELESNLKLGIKDLTRFLKVEKPHEPSENFTKSLGSIKTMVKNKKKSFLNSLSDNKTRTKESPVSAETPFSEFEIGNSYSGDFNAASETNESAKTNDKEDLRDRKMRVFNPKTSSDSNEKLNFWEILGVDMSNMSDSWNKY